MLSNTTQILKQASFSVGENMTKCVIFHSSVSWWIQGVTTTWILLLDKISEVSQEEEVKKIFLLSKMFQG